MIEVKSTHGMLVRVPYNMGEDEIAIDPAAVGRTTQEEMADISAHYQWDDPQEMYHIFLGTVILHEKTGAPLGECLSTAKIWWRG